MFLPTSPLRWPLVASHFDEAFIEQLVAATGERTEVPGSSGIVGFGIGKKVLATVEIVDGRVIGPVEADPVVTLVFKGAQVDAWVAGELNLSQAFMRGDFKPVGHMGPLAAALEVLDDPAVVAQLT